MLNDSVDCDKGTNTGERLQMKIAGNKANVV